MDTNIEYTTDDDGVAIKVLTLAQTEIITCQFIGDPSDIDSQYAVVPRSLFRALKYSLIFCQKQLQKIRELKSGKCEDTPPPKWLGDAMDREKPLSIEEQIQRLFDRIGSKDDQPQRLQAKVENMDYRLDLRIYALEQRMADAEKYLAQLVNASGYAIHVKRTPEGLREMGIHKSVPDGGVCPNCAPSKPFDPTAFPNVGDVVECVVDGVGDWPKGVKKIVGSTDQTNTAFCCHNSRSRWFWLSKNEVYRFRRLDPAKAEFRGTNAAEAINPFDERGNLKPDQVSLKNKATLPPFVSQEIVDATEQRLAELERKRDNPASKDKPHNPKCLCKDCHEDEQPAPLPPFQDVEKIGGDSFVSPFASLVDMNKRNGVTDYKVDGYKFAELLANSRLDQQRIKMLVDWINDNGEKISRQELLRITGCDKI